MPKKRSDIIEFAIGTKIKYNDKLYEVVEQKYCDECSIATICANSDKTSGNPIKVLSHDKRLSVFGECSGIVRSDRKSIVFKEVSSNEKALANEEDVYDVEVLYKNDKELLPIKINIPSGYVIDEERSNLTNGIIEFKSKWLSIEDIYRLVKENDYLTYRSSIVSFRDGKLIALANLMDIARYFNGNWNYDATKGDKGYIIAYDTSMTEPYYTISNIDSVTKSYYGNPVFRNKDDARYVIDNPHFKAILDKIFKV